MNEITNSHWNKCYTERRSDRNCIVWYCTDINKNPFPIFSFSSYPQFEERLFFFPLLDFKTDAYIIMFASFESEDEENIISQGGVIYENKSFKTVFSFSV